MSSIFNLDAPIWVFMGEVADIIILGVLWWLCCCGIITIGASTTALYYVLGKKMRKETTYVVKDFFKSFKQNFRQSVPVSIGMTIAFISLGLYISFIFGGLYDGGNSPYLKFIIPLTILFGFEVVNLNTYVWALLSRFEMTNGAILRSGLLMVHKHLLTTLWSMGVMVAVGIAIAKFPLLLVVAPSVIVLGQSYMLQNLFAKYIEAAESAKQEETQEQMDEVLTEMIDDSEENEIQS